MATVYSLICWGGSSGKSVTVSASTDYVTLTRHGLRDRKGVQFTAGTLPSVSGSALSLNTTYYANVINSSNFELYYDSALSSKINFTSNGSSLILKGAYYKSLSDTSRWGTRIYDGLTSCNSARQTGASAYDDEVWEIGEDFIEDINTNSIVFSIPAPRTLITPINLAGHNGVYDSGYTLLTASTSIGSGNVNMVCPITIEGITYKNSSTGGGFSLGYPGAEARNCIAIGGGTTGTSYGFRPYERLVRVENCLAVNFARGFELHTTCTGMVVANNTASKNGVGFYTGYTSGLVGYIFNNVSAGNTTNWGTQPTGIDSATKNAGVSGDSIWDTTSTKVTITTSDFANYSLNNFSPASASSGLVDAALPYYKILDYDISKAERPNYNNGGAEGHDIGAFEYDHGYGPHPASATISLTSIVSGSRVLITKASDGTVLYNDVPGTSLSFSTTHIGDFNVVVRKATASPFYREFNASGTTVADQTTAIKCLQQLDE